MAETQTGEERGIIEQDGLESDPGAEEASIPAWRETGRHH